MGRRLPLATHLLACQLRGKPVQQGDLRDNPAYDDSLVEDEDFLLTHDGAPDVIGMHGDELRYLACVSRDRVKEVVCEFNESHLEKLSQSSDPQLCKAVQGQKVTMPNYGVPVSVDAMDLAPSGTPGDQAVRLDLENDGHVRRVIEVRYSSMHGAGCEITEPGVLEDDSDTLDPSRMEWLAELSMSCGAIVKPFLFRGQTYVDANPGDDAHSAQRHVVKLTPQGMRELCTWTRRPVYSIDEHHLQTQDPSTAAGN
jgi:hypothetical protein